MSSGRGWHLTKACVEAEPWPAPISKAAEKKAKFILSPDDWTKTPSLPHLLLHQKMQHWVDTLKPDGRALVLIVSQLLWPRTESGKIGLKIPAKESFSQEKRKNDWELEFRISDFGNVWLMCVVGLCGMRTCGSFLALCFDESITISWREKGCSGKNNSVINPKSCCWWPWSLFGQFCGENLRLLFCPLFSPFLPSFWAALLLPCLACRRRRCCCYCPYFWNCSWITQAMLSWTRAGSCWSLRNSAMTKTFFPKSNYNSPLWKHNLTTFAKNSFSFQYCDFPASKMVKNMYCCWVQEKDKQLDLDAHTTDFFCMIKNFCLNG